ncbi:hypothetical protein EYC80_005304 [Monilinia laxa]|uniref:Uncharacterized protein n=1 Tax=Monilinia laxa TaxID=61186 RepID=A0A5N6KJJ2_MONLA|nr:hypothetical protein EYC80_005304 [Monilinia laxa]
MYSNLYNCSIIGVLGQLCGGHCGRFLGFLPELGTHSAETQSNEKLYYEAAYLICFLHLKCGKSLSKKASAASDAALEKVTSLVLMVKHMGISTVLGIIAWDQTVQNGTYGEFKS